MQKNKVRGTLIILSLLALLVSLVIENKMVALIVMSFCFLFAAIVLYQHLNELTDISPDNPKMETLKTVTIFNMVSSCCPDRYRHLADI